MPRLKWPKPAAYIVHRAMAQPELQWRNTANALSHEPLFTRDQVMQLLRKSADIARRERTRFEHPELE